MIAEAQLWILYRIFSNDFLGLSLQNFAWPTIRSFWRQEFNRCELGETLMFYR
jgi:hypothetical protein